ncbi:hypothetical protein [Xanthomonas phage OP2]|uniref:Uncharacterized protein n=1 Tax=Xanthomonas phage OP2 TaxID=331627 RepID=Q2NPB0_9CAUD|nr:hypothetical protein OP2_ORF22 [Xanthomonas phage OP2]BAE72786.1 hypothetical protein [Xanthomonas phage OP2]
MNTDRTIHIACNVVAIRNPRTESVASFVLRAAQLFVAVAKAPVVPARAPATRTNHGNSLT